MAQKIQQNLEARQELQLKLTPSLIQTVEILQMPLQELIEHIELESISNPFLEISNNEFKSIDSTSLNSDSESTILGQLDDEKPRFKSSSIDEENEMPLWETLEENSDNIYENIKMQISLLSYDEKTKNVLYKILDKIDLDGFLRISMEELLEYVNKETGNEITMEELKNCLEILKTKVQPKGIGSLNIKECLIAQVDTMSDNYELIYKIIENDLLSIDSNSSNIDVNYLSEKYGKSPESIRESLNTISKFSVSPLANYTNEIVRKTKPDAEIYYVDSNLVVNVSTPYLPKLSLNKEYSKFLNDKKAGNFLKGKYLTAKKILKDVNLRKSFLLKILYVITEEQRDFFENGIVAMKSLNLETVSQRTGLSKSTISRVISNKYIQTPRGLFNIKFFLASSPSRNTKVHYSKMAICDKIKELISEENKLLPYTDTQLKFLIEKKLNITLARRTITKFRLEMNIPSAGERKNKFSSGNSIK